MVTCSTHADLVFNFSQMRFKVKNKNIRFKRNNKEIEIAVWIVTSY